MNEVDTSGMWCAQCQHCQGILDAAFPSGTKCPACEHTLRSYYLKAETAHITVRGSDVNFELQPANQERDWAVHWNEIELEVVRLRTPASESLIGRISPIGDATCTTCSSASSLSRTT